MNANTDTKYPSEAPRWNVRSVLDIPLFLLDTLRAASFPLFLLYIVLSFLRPLDTFWPDLLAHRPMLWAWIFAFVAGVLNALHRRRLGARPIHFLLLVGFVVVIMLSMVANGWTGGALQAAGEFSASTMIFVVAALNLTSIERIRLTCLAVVVTMMATAVLSLYSFYTGFEWKTFVLQQSATDISGFPGGEPFGFVPADDTSGLWLWRIRGAGFLNDPNDFAQMIVATLPLLWAYAGLMPAARGGTAMSAVQRLFRGVLDRIVGLRQVLFAGLPAALLLFGIYMSHSRGALLGVASLLFFSVQKKLGNVRTAILVGMGGLGVLALNVAGGRAMSMKESSADDRIGAWGSAIQMFKSHPLLGVGYNNFLEHHHLTAHNSFVLCFAELGLIGYFPWMALLVLTYLSLKQVIDNRPEGDEHYRIAVLLRSALLGYLTCAWFLSRSYSTGLFFLLALCCSVSMSLRYQLADERRAAPIAAARARRGAAKSAAAADAMANAAASATPSANTTAASAAATTIATTFGDEEPRHASTHPLARAELASQARQRAIRASARKPLVFGDIPTAQWVRWTLIGMFATMAVVQVFVMVGRG